MDKKQNITNTFIALIISLITIIGFAGGFISNQSKIEVQLTNIQSQVTEINVKLDKRDEEIKSLTERVTVIETELKK